MSRGTFRRVEGFDRARERYPQVSAPITLVDTEDAWSRPAERDRVAQALGNVHRITVPRTGRFSALERPHTMARILLDAASG